MAKIAAPKSSTSSERSGGFALAQRLVKTIAFGAGGVCTFVAFASLVGVATGNAWARAIVGLVLTIAVPAVVLDRALPKKDAGKARPGLAGDVVSLVWVGIALAFVGVGQPVTRPLLVREGDRWAESGSPVVAHVVYLMAGVRPVDALPVPPPSAGAAPSASASDGGR